MAEETTVHKQDDTSDEKGKTRTFTQEELDNIVRNRVLDVKNKYADYEDLKKKASEYDKQQEANKSDMQKAIDRANALQAKLDALNAEKKVAEVRKKVADESKVPIELLTGNDEESCKAQADVIKTYLKTAASYPDVKDSGEVNHTGKKSTKELFADWFNQAVK